MMQGKIIAILGIAGSGKTTLGKNLEKISGATFLEENWKDIPFVSSVDGKQSSNFEVCIGFLNMRYEQIHIAKKIKQSGKVVVIDTIFEMTDIYAKQMLKSFEYEEFKKVYDVFSKNISVPDEYVHLVGDIGTIQQRALARNLGIDLEKTMLSIQSLEKSKSEIVKLLSEKEARKITEIDVVKHDIRNDKFLSELKDKLGIL